MEIENKILGTYKETTFHYIHNHNKRFMINATDIASHFNINLSKFLEAEETKDWIKLLLEKENRPLKYQVTDNGIKSSTDYDYTFEDLILIENGIYYFNKILTYELCKPLGMFYWWIDGQFWELIKNGPRGNMYY